MINIQNTYAIIKNRYSPTRLIWEAETLDQAIAFWLIHFVWVNLMACLISSLLFIAMTSGLSLDRLFFQLFGI